MKHKSDNQRVLLVADNKADAQDISDILEVIGIEIIIALDNESTVQSFDKHQPQLLICAREHIRDNENLYLDLYCNSEHIHTSYHQTIVLCKLADSKKAYDLCRRGIFTDYVVDKPRHDIFRLRLSIEIMLDNFARNQEQHKLGREFRGAGNEAKSLANSVNNIRVERQQLSDNSAVKMQSLNEQVLRETQSVLSSLYTGIEGSALKRSFADKIQGILNSVGNEMTQEINILNKALDDVSANYIDTLDQLIDAVKDIPATILIIDDNEAFAETIGEILSEDGYRTLCSNDAKQGINLAIKQLPDLILLDISMPGMDGLQATLILKNNPHIKDIPIIILSAKNDRDVVMKLKAAGAKGFISKPTKAQVILDKIAKTLYKRDRS